MSGCFILKLCENVLHKIGILKVIQTKNIKRKINIINNNNNNNNNNKQTNNKINTIRNLLAE